MWGKVKPFLGTSQGSKYNYFLYTPKGGVTNPPGTCVRHICIIDFDLFVYLYELQMWKGSSVRMELPEKNMNGKPVSDHVRSQNIL